MKAKAPPPDGYKRITRSLRCATGHNLLDVIKCGAAAAVAGRLETAAVPVVCCIISAGLTLKNAVRLVLESPQLVRLYHFDPQAFKKELRRRGVTGKLGPMGTHGDVLRAHDSACEECRGAQYDLCARCGKILGPGEIVGVVYRNWNVPPTISPAVPPERWAIFSHPTNPGSKPCAPQGVRGWRAIESAATGWLDGTDHGVKYVEALITRRAEKALEHKGDPICVTGVGVVLGVGLASWRVAIAGMVKESMSLISSDLCQSEMDAVTISQNDFLPRIMPTTSGEEEVDEISPLDKIDAALQQRTGRGGELGLTRGRLGELSPSAHAHFLGARSVVFRDVLHYERARLYQPTPTLEQVVLAILNEELWLMTRAILNEELRSISELRAKALKKKMARAMPFCQVTQTNWACDHDECKVDVLQAKILAQEEDDDTTVLRRDMRALIGPRPGKESPGKLARLLPPERLTFDANDRPVEYVLHSESKIFGGERLKSIKLDSEHLAPLHQQSGVDEFGFYWFHRDSDPGRRESDGTIRIVPMPGGRSCNTRSNPEMFDFSDELFGAEIDLRCPVCNESLGLAHNYCTSCGGETSPAIRATLLREWTEREVKSKSKPSLWKGNPGHIPYGYGARIKPAFLAALNAATWDRPNSTASVTKTPLWLRS